MKLELSQIKEITLGASRVEETNDGIQFFRFSKEQEDAYEKYRESFYFPRTFGTAGIKLSFRTNSESLFLKTDVSGAGVKKYFSFDIFVNGKMVDSLCNFNEKEIPDDYKFLDYEVGEFSKKFYLGAGEKDVCIHFPWAVKAILKDLELDDNAFIKPVKPKKKMICFGDSITHGADALYSSRRYPAQLADFFDAEEFNKAICGDYFFPELAAVKEEIEPDYITVAYGTNDWSRCTKDEFTHNCKEFYRNLSENYPNAKIFALAPIWRKEMHEERKFGAFEDIAKIMKSLVEEFDNVTFLDGFNFVPHREVYFADLTLHPTNEGFDEYFKNLSKEMLSAIEG